MDDLGYTGFAIAFYEDKTELVGTKMTLPCFTPDFIEFIHAKIISGIAIAINI